MYPIFPEENRGLGRLLLIPRFGVYGGTMDFDTSTLNLDMETEFLPEEFMYDLPEAPPTWSCRWRHPGPDYPPEAPKFKDPVREVQLE